MRPKKKGKTPQDRIKAITEEPLFDCTELGLSLSLADRQLLVEEVNAVFHSAASVRFDDPLSDAIILNTGGTREVVTLVSEMRQLQCFVHVSTAYCNCDKKIVGEQLYPAHVDWRKAIQQAESCDWKTINILTRQYIAPLPNTYTFTKSLSEHVVYDLCTGANIPLVIYRPSIVVSMHKDPFPGWVDNINGVMGVG